jgi:hypothetical protein
LHSNLRKESLIVRSKRSVELDTLEERRCKPAMSEEVLGVIRVFRPAFMRQIYETVYFAPDRTVVARTSGGKGGMLFGAVGGAIEGALQYEEAKKKGERYSKLSLEDILKADKNSYAIPNSEIIEVELKKFGRGTKLNIKTSQKHGRSMYGEAKWYVSEGAWKDIGEKYENMLRPIFKDRLIVKK